MSEPSTLSATVPTTGTTSPVASAPPPTVTETAAPSTSSSKAVTATPPVRFRVFFSWQSDLPIADTTAAIRAAMRTAATQIEKDLSYALTIFRDEATREESGSPDIPSTIQEKIDIADMFIGDVTTAIRGPTAESKCSPNPNVLVELGYAAATLGWSRVVMLFNEEYGSLKELPFDIDRRRISKFNFRTPAAGAKDGKATTKEMEARLASFMTEVIRAVIDKRPLRPAELKLLDPVKMKRHRDVRTLTSLMERISLPVMDAFFDKASTKYLLHDEFYFHEGVMELVLGSSFHLHDEKAAELVDAFIRPWEEMHSFSEWFSPTNSGNLYAFTDITLNRTPPTKQHWDAWEKAQADFELVCANAFKAWRALLDYINREYLEIDVKVCSTIAFEDMVRFEKEMDERIGGSSRSRKPATKKAKDK